MGAESFQGWTCSVVNIPTRFRVSRLACLTSDRIGSDYKNTH
jgi:hypothetical protein